MKTQITPQSLPSSYNFHKLPDHDLAKFFGKQLQPIQGDRPILPQIEGTALDFELETRPCYYKTDEGFKDYDAKRFLVNSSTNEIFDIVGKSWTPHQPKNVLQSFQDWVQETGELNLTHVGQLNGGRIVYALADYPDVIQFGDDTTVAKVLLTNMNQLGFSTRVEIFTYRVVCLNGLTVRNKEQDRSIRINHLTDITQENLLHNTLSSLHSQFEQHKRQMTGLTQVQMPKSEAIALLIKNFGNPTLELEDQPKAVQVILQLFDGKAKGSEYASVFNTAYGLLQSTTEYLNHHARKTQVHTSSLLYGTKANSAVKMQQSLVNCYL
jgi:phage/plasmid-like protein (TIGR03299 family)